ncbi:MULTISPECIES: excalibur calcium-binding domain-containing protein [unclassified Lysobacter]|uniref:excalibur calcium-binding domain-containing protein n=1 Tax=unclassified Lysobacter TaxID=2635362 RepID=UPI0019100EC1|nr:MULTISPECIES: excalibur calcium-binding domain-containing protein [unclassified Lysobacter]
MKVKDLFLPLALAGAGLFAYNQFKAKNAGPADLQAVAKTLGHVAPAQEDQSWRSNRAENAATGPATAQFKCDGRTHCAQMTSCAEATFFLQHCPNTQMDGNNDGEPCEQQWCN